MGNTFTNKVIEMIKMIPYGKIATYGMIARLAGNPKASRGVSYILHSCSDKYDLPWHRVINSKGTISLKKGYGYEIQKELLLKEGIAFGKDDRISFSKHLWDIHLEDN